jgi:hypothetical protein
MRFLVIALFLIKSFCCIAQADTTVAKADTTIFENYLCFKTSPLAFIDPYGSFSYRVGVEFKLIRNTAFSIEVGKYYGLLGKSAVKLHPDGYIIRPELKWYIPKFVYSSSYVSLDFFFKKIDFGFTDSIHLNGAPTYETEYTIFKEVYGINIRGGAMVVGRKMIAEMYMGAGVRIIKGYNSLQPEENDHILHGEGSGGIISDGQRLVHGIWPNITIGVKFGYAAISKAKRMPRPTK